MAKPSRHRDIPDDPVTLLNKYKAKIYETLRRTMLPGLPSDATDDIYGEVVVKVFDKDNWRRIRASNDVEAYLRKMVRNAMIDYVRRNGIKEAARPLAAKLQPTKGSPTFDQVAGNELREKMREAIDKLSPKKRSIFLGRFAEDKTWSELGDQFKINPHTASKYGMEAWKQVERHMRELLDEPPP